MTPLKLEQDFAAAVLDADAAVPGGLAGKSLASLTRRFGVYRNNVYASLIEVLQGRFPVTARLVGDEFFRAMARLYVEEAPPCSPVPLHYGAGFPEFVASFAPAEGVPYLADMAALEWARSAAYHAADAVPMPLEALEALAPAVEHAAHVRLLLHPSLHLVSSAYPIVTIFELHGQETEPAPVKLEGGGEDALILRPLMEVEVRRVPKGAVPFIRALQGGRPILDAHLGALAEAPEFDLAATLAGLMTSGAIVGVSTGRENA
jgi:hypothetical protein